MHTACPLCSSPPPQKKNSTFETGAAAETTGSASAAISVFELACGWLMIIFAMFA
jgi:hypothetical protein